MADFGYIQIIRVCNQKCLFCSNPSSGDVMSLDKIKKIILRYKKDKLAGVLLTGGEPTMHPKLIEIIKYCAANEIACKLITNGQRLAYSKYLRALIAAGLRQLHISIYSHKKQIQSKLTQNNAAIDNLTTAFRNLARHPELAVNVNITINSQNQDHLQEVVKWVVDNYPHKLHFVFNNLDPRSLAIKENTYVVPRLPGLKKSLLVALQFLNDRQITFRVERVPLCYMLEFAHTSTETRKIVKSEKRSLFFLDKKGRRIQTSFEQQKSALCKECSLNRICAGVDDYGEYYKLSELVPVKLSNEQLMAIINKIKKDL